MPRLVPNPIGDLMHPLQRIESAITALADKLRPVDSLPDVHEELVRVNRTLDSISDCLIEIRADLAAARTVSIDAAAGSPKRATARSRAAG
jgi:hypothetical protein